MTPEEEQDIHLLVEDADEVVINHQVPEIDWYEKWVEDDGKKMVYFGTKESYEQWKKEQVN